MIISFKEISQLIIGKALGWVKNDVMGGEKKILIKKNNSRGSREEDDVTFVSISFHLFLVPIFFNGAGGNEMK